MRLSTWCEYEVLRPYCGSETTAPPPPMGYPHEQGPRAAVGTKWTEVAWPGSFCRRRLDVRVSARQSFFLVQASQPTPNKHVLEGPWASLRVTSRDHGVLQPRGRQ